MSDEELDNLFRKSAESFDPPYDPEAWNAMEKKLDSVEGKNAWWQKLFFPLLILIYTCSMVADSKLPDIPVQPHEKIATETLEEAQITNQSQESNKDREVKKQLSLVKQKSSLELKAASKKAANDLYTLPTDTENLKTDTDTKTPLKPQLKTLQREATVIQPSTGNEETTAQEVQPPMMPQTAQVILTKSEIAEEHTEAEQPVMSAITVVQDSLLLQPAAQQEIASIADSSLRKQSKRDRVFLSKIQLNLIVAPDFTTVKFKNPDAVSANAGLLLGVPITDRLSLVTGVVWANKVYGANPEDYTGYWSSSYSPTSIEATCKVLDIPLNLRYQLLEWDKNSIAVQAGLSSYIMLKEDYTYYYEGGHGTYEKSVEFTNENKHLFGVQNLSVSYARKLSPAVSVGVEPFIKVPLTGIGAGHVKLSSAGVFFTVGYTLQLKK